MARTLVIGDIHGCIEELDALCEEVALEADDQVVMVGDLVAKGPDSRGVIRRARELGAQVVRGNHDEHCLHWWRAHQNGEEPPSLGPKHLDVCRSLTHEDWEWLDSLPLVLLLEQHAAIVVHAGLVPGVPLDEQDPNHLLFMRSIRPDGTVTSKVGDGEPWASLWPGPEEVIFGHDAVRGLQRWPHAVGLDTGCVYGGRLTGYLLPERQLVSVPARKAWSSPGRGRGH
jgi:predicted phosphodiesterase